jgi:hypothetical protein
LTAYGWRGGLAGAAGGLLHVERTARGKWRSTQPYRQSGPAAWLARGALVALVTSILPGLLVAWPETNADGYRFAAVVAVGAAMLALVLIGRFAVVEQAMVRRTLRRLDLAPLPLRPFLDYATQCLFLRQAGDGYPFEHLSLLEFFAKMWEFGDVRAERLGELTQP